MIITGCGMLPISMKDNQLYILCGIENNGRISDLGGRIEKDEDPLQCAVREFYEESVGLIASYKELINHKIYYTVKLRFRNKCYISYVIKTEYKDVEEEYKKLYKYVRQHRSQRKDIDFREYKWDMLYRKNVYPNGYFEFKDLKWILLEELEEIANTKDRKMSYRLRNIIRQIPI